MSTAPQKLLMDNKYGGKESGQPPLMASMAERKQVLKKPAVSQVEAMQQAVWRTWAPILKSWARMGFRHQDQTAEWRARQDLEPVTLCLEGRCV